MINSLDTFIFLRSNSYRAMSAGYLYNCCINNSCTRVQLYLATSPRKHEKQKKEETPVLVSTFLPVYSNLMLKIYGFGINRPSPLSMMLLILVIYVLYT